MIRFQNGSVHPGEMLDTQGMGMIRASDLPIGTFCWLIGNRRYFGMFEKCLGKRIA